MSITETFAENPVGMPRYLLAVDEDLESNSSSIRVELDAIKYPPTVGETASYIPECMNLIFMFACPHGKSDHVVRVYVYIVELNRWITMDNGIPRLAAIRQEAGVFAKTTGKGEILVCSGWHQEHAGKTFSYEPEDSVDRFFVHEFEEIGDANIYRVGGSFVQLDDKHVARVGMSSDYSNARGGYSTFIYDDEDNMMWDFRPRDVDPFIYKRNAAVSLGNNKMMLIGGEEENGPTDYCSLVDEADNATAAPYLNTRRAGHAACELADGRVFVCGGYSSRQPRRLLTSVEVYNHADRSWTLVGNMRTAREGHSCIQLSTGIVLIVGGWVTPPAGGSSSRLPEVTECEGFNIDLGVSFSMPSVPEFCVTFALASYSEKEHVRTFLQEEYDARRRPQSVAGEIDESRSERSIVSYQTQKPRQKKPYISARITQNEAGSQLSSDDDRRAIITTTFTPPPPEFDVITTLTPRKPYLVVIASEIDTTHLIDKYLAYDIGMRKWSVFDVGRIPTRCLVAPSVGLQAAATSDPNTWLVVSGCDKPVAFRFYPYAIGNKFEVVKGDSLVTMVCRRGGSAVQLGDGRILYFGGVDEKGFWGNNITLVNTNTRRIDVRGHTMGFFMRNACVVVLANRDVFICGGVHHEGTMSDITYIYRVASHKYTMHQDMPIRASYQAGCLLPSRRVFVCGGRTTRQNSPIPSVTKKAYEFDVQNNRWYEMDNMSIARAEHTCSFLSNENKVMIIGGEDYDFRAADSTSCEFYDLSTAKFERAPSMPGSLYKINTIQTQK